MDSIIIGVISVIVANLVTIITLYIHLDNKTENRLSKMQEMMDRWQQTSQNEMKDFHSKLAQQDAQFKSGILLLEEKFKKVA